MISNQFEIMFFASSDARTTCLPNLNVYSFLFLIFACIYSA